MPIISVVMGVHNGEKTIRNAVNSILNQTFSDFEFIICDDNSCDNTQNILQNIAKMDSRVIVLKNDVNSGLAATLNKCIEVSRGKYIARMDDDDISHSDRFAKQVEFLENNPRYAICGTRRYTFDDQGIWNTCGKSGELSKEDIISGNIFTHPSVIMRRDALVAVGGYTVSPRTIRGQDFDLWCKMYFAGNVGYVLDEILFDYYEDRNKIKETSFKYRWNNYRTHKMWRKKMKLPLKYDVYAYKELLAAFIPKKFLIARKKKLFKSGETTDEKKN